MRYSLSVMFHVFPVVKRRENRAVMSKDHRHSTQCWRMWKRLGLTSCGGRKEKKATHNNRNITSGLHFASQVPIRKITDTVLLTSCYVPCVPSGEEERIQGSHEQGSLTLHTLLEHVERSGTHQLRWEGGKKNDIFVTATATCITMCLQMWGCVTHSLL